MEVRGESSIEIPFLSENEGSSLNDFVLQEDNRICYSIYWSFVAFFDGYLMNCYGEPLWRKTINQMTTQQPRVTLVKTLWNRVENTRRVFSSYH